MLLVKIKRKTDDAITKICAELGMGRNDVRKVIKHRSEWTFEMLSIGTAVRWRYFGAFTPYGKKPKIRHDVEMDNTIENTQPTQ